ncbi:unnamed protein product [Closterium sp. NIES-53]
MTQSHLSPRAFVIKCFRTAPSCPPPFPSSRLPLSPLLLPFVTPPLRYPLPPLPLLLPLSPISQVWICHVSCSVGNTTHSTPHVDDPAAMGY